MNKKAQTLSMDLLLGLTVFVVIFIAIFGFINYLSTETVPGKLKEESELILSSIGSENSVMGFIEGNQINTAKLQTIAKNESYDILRSIVGTKYNFCIYFEDENGNLLNLDGEPADLGNEKIAIGDISLSDEDNLKINNVPCGKTSMVS